MSYTFRGFEIINNVIASRDHNIYVTNSVTLKQIVTRTNHNRLNLDISVIDRNGSYLAKANKFAGVPETMVYPQDPKVLSRMDTNMRNNNAVVDAEVAAGNNHVNINTNGLTGILPAGLAIKFSNHDKIYFLIDDYTMGGVITIETDVVINNDVTTTTTVEWGDDCTFRYLDQDFGSFRSLQRKSGFNIYTGIKLVEYL